MKRTWMWGLAALPVVVGLVFAQALADKRPRLVARGVVTSFLKFSPDGRLLFAHSPAQTFGVTIALKDGSRTQIPGDYNPETAFFSSDSRRIYEIFSLSEVNMEGIDVYYRIVGHDARDGKSATKFAFPSTGLLEDAYVRGDQIVVESSAKIWYLNARDMKVTGAQSRKQHLSSVHLLCPDGQTVCRRNQVPTDVWEFVDLPTGKLLWKLPLDDTGYPIFSSDGRLTLRKSGDQVIARDTRTGAEKWRLRGPQSSVIALAPDQSALYEARENGELWKWPR